MRRWGFSFNCYMVLLIICISLTLLISPASSSMTDKNISSTEGAMNEFECLNPVVFAGGRGLRLSTATNLLIKNSLLSPNDLVAVSIPYPDKKEEKEIFDGKEPEKSAIDMKKVNEDMKKISKILPKGAKVLEAEIDDKSVRYVIDGSIQYDKETDLLEALLELMGKLGEVNYPEFVHIYEACILRPGTTGEKYLLHLYLIYESKSDEVLKKEKIPLALPKQIEFVKKIRSLAYPNITIIYVRFSDDKREIEISAITKPGLRNPNFEINDFKSDIAQWISGSNISLHIVDPRYYLDYKIFTIRIKY